LFSIELCSFGGRIGHGRKELSSNDTSRITGKSGDQFLAARGDEVNEKLLAQFQSLSADKWLLRHQAMSEEDYAKDPTRNRLAVLLNRTNHLSYHLGQATLALE